jgi:hypothetical protein
MKKNIIIVIIILGLLHSHYGYSQISKVYSTIETRNVLYYKVEEIINMKFGGTTTRYTVSDLSLISKVDLGPDNVRIITPIYKDEKYKKKNYYIETKNLNRDSRKSQEPTNLVEIKIDSKNIEIPENSEVAKASLAMVIGNLTKLEPIAVVKNEPQREKRDHIFINIIDVYERVAEKGYKSIYIFKEIANYYFFNNQMEKAARWYEELFAMTNNLDPVYYFRFGDALKKTGKTERGNAMVEKFNKSEDQ